MRRLWCRVWAYRCFILIFMCTRIVENCSCGKWWTFTNNWWNEPSYCPTGLFFFTFLLFSVPRSNFGLLLLLLFFVANGQLATSTKRDVWIFRFVSLIPYDINVEMNNLFISRYIFSLYVTGSRTSGALQKRMPLFWLCAAIEHSQLQRIVLLGSLHWL